jgi:3-phenylpropionate/cinnamic acid dioxygenase small subunit
MRTDQYYKDRIDISDLLIAYAELIDTKQFDNLSTVFTVNAEIDYTAFGGIKGDLSEIIAFLKKSMALFPRHQHMLGNSVVKIDGDIARVRTQCHNPMVLAHSDGSEQTLFLGLWYVDELHRTPAGWRIAKRAQELCFAHNMPEELAVPH